jgi:hypothetical protein
MKTWDQFFPDVLIKAPGTSAPAVRRALVNAAQDFCRESRAWLVEMDPITTAADTIAYTLELPSRTELVRLEGATLNGVDFGVWRNGERKRHERFIYTNDLVNVVFDEQPPVDQPLVITASLMPAEGATGVDDAIYRQYRRDIALGAVAAITGLPDQQAAFESRCAAVRTALFFGNARTRPRAVPKFF